jgi:hypothetical protein
MRDKTIAKLAERVADPVDPMPRRLRAARRLASEKSAASLTALVRAAIAAPSEVIDAEVRAVFSGPITQLVIDEICAVWYAEPNRFLGELIAENHWIALEPVKVRVRTALHNKQLELLAGGGEELAEELLRIVHDDRLKSLHVRAKAALASLTDTGAREAVCAAAIDRDDRKALNAVRAGGYRPRDPVRRALLVFLAGEFDEYQELDFDGRLLRSARLTAEPELVERLTFHARALGRVEWVRSLTAVNPHEQDFTDEEWRSFSEVLVRRGREDELWRMANEVPPLRAVGLLRRLGESRWRPADEAERCRYLELLELSEQCARHPAELVLRLPLADSWPVSVAVSHEGTWLAAGDAHGGVYLWHLPERRLIAQDRIGTEPVDPLAFTPDDGLLVAAGHETALRCWRLPEFTRAGVADGYGSDLAVILDGRRLVTGKYARGLVLLELPSGLPIRTLTDWGPQDLVASADGTRVAAAVGDGMQVWRTDSVELVAELSGGGQFPAISPDGSLLVTQHRDGPCLLRRLPSGEQVRALEMGYGYSQLQFTPDGELLIGTDDDVVAKLWRMPSGAPAGTIELDGSAASAAGTLPATITFTVTANGHMLVSAEEDEHLRLWRLPSGEPAGVLCHGIYIEDLQTHRGSGLVSGLGPDRSIRLWSPRIAAAARTPVGSIRPEEVAALRAMPDQLGGEQAWIALIANLTGWRHRHDIEIAPSLPGPGATDIALDPDPGVT